MSLKVVVSLLVLSLLLSDGLAVDKKRRTRLRILVNELEVRFNLLQNSIGSTFTRWGKTTCPANSTQVYSGVVGGSYFTHSGAAGNTLCLTKTPEFDAVPKPESFAIIYGAEYRIDEGSHENFDVPCSVCEVPQSTTIMVPATLTCPSGWTPQYTGHLTAGHFTHTATSEYLCLDGSPDDIGLKSRLNGRLFYYTVTGCGSLPCPPFAKDKVVTCVVCSKKQAQLEPFSPVDEL